MRGVRIAPNVVIDIDGLLDTDDSISVIIHAAHVVAEIGNPAGPVIRIVIHHVVGPSGAFRRNHETVEYLGQRMGFVSNRSVAGQNFFGVANVGAEKHTAKGNFHIFTARGACLAVEIGQCRFGQDGYAFALKRVLERAAHGFKRAAARVKICPLLAHRDFLCGKQPVQKRRLLEVDRGGLIEEFLAPQVGYL